MEGSHRDELQRLKKLILHHDRVHVSLSEVLINQAHYAHQNKEQYVFVSSYICFTILFLFFGCIWIVASQIFSSSPAGTFGLGEHETFQTTVLDSLYASWLMLTTIGFGDIYPTTQGGKIMASVYMIGTMAFLSRGLSALYAYEKRVAEQTKRAVGLTLGLKISESSRKRFQKMKTLQMKQNSQCMKRRSVLLCYAKTFDTLSTYIPLLIAWFYIDFISLLYASTEGWRPGVGEWGCGKCRLFAFMTMSTIGWGISDFYDPLPPDNYQNLTIKDEMVLCKQLTTRGTCIWSPSSSSCVCSLSDGGRTLLLPFSLFGFVVTGIALSTLFDHTFWQNRLCCCINKVCFRWLYVKLCRDPKSGMEERLRRSSLTVDGSSDGGSANANTNKTDNNDDVVILKTRKTSNMNTKKPCISSDFKGECYLLLAVLIPISFLLIVLPLCMMKWMSTLEECVTEEYIGNLGYGFLSAAFVIIQTASTVGYGDSCTSRVISEIDPWLIILFSCLLLSVFGSYLNLTRYNVMSITNKGYRCLTNTKCCQCCLLQDHVLNEEEEIEMNYFETSNSQKKNEEKYEDEEDSWKMNNSEAKDRLTAPLWFLVVFVLLVNFLFFSIFLWPPITGYKCFPEINKFVDFMYFFITTTTTVGFGDITPHPTCIQGRFFSILAMVAGSSSLVVLLTEILIQVDTYSSKIREKMAHEIHERNGLNEVKSLLRLTKKSQAELLALTAEKKEEEKKEEEEEKEKHDDMIVVSMNSDDENLLKME